VLVDSAGSDVGIIAVLGAFNESARARVGVFFFESTSHVGVRIELGEGSATVGASALVCKAAVNGKLRTAEVVWF
jgi:hypothetical protein